MSHGSDVPHVYDTLPWGVPLSRGTSDESYEELGGSVGTAEPSNELEVLVQVQHGKLGQSGRSRDEPRQDVVMTRLGA